MRTIDLEGITKTLVDEGVLSFADAFDGLLGSVAAKQATLLGDKLTTLKTSLPADFQEAVNKGLTAWRKSGSIRHIWAKDAAVWTNGPEAKWLNWLNTVDDRLHHIADRSAPTSAA